MMMEDVAAIEPQSVGPAATVDDVVTQSGR